MGGGEREFMYDELNISFGCGEGGEGGESPQVKPELSTSVLRKLLLCIDAKRIMGLYKFYWPIVKIGLFIHVINLMFYYSIWSMYYGSLICYICLPKRWL